MRWILRVPRLPLKFAFFASLIFCASLSLADDEDRDDLPGVLSGPSRQDVADLIRKVAREEATDARIDEILSFFRPRAKNLQRDFPTIASTVLDAKFVAEMDAIARDLTGQPADTRNLIVRAINKNVAGVDVDLRTDMADDLKRRAEVPMTLKGKVVDERGIPMPNVLVSTSGALTRTDAKGKFALTFRRPKNLYATVNFEAKGYALGETTFDLASLADADGRTYPLLKQAICDGKVVDTDGKPIAGAEISMYIHEFAFRRGFDDEGLRAEDRNSFVTLITKSDAEGRYAFRGLPPKEDLPTGQYAFTMFANHPKYLRNSDNFGEDQDPRANITIPLSKGCALSGVVIDPAGRPVANAPVRVTLANGGGPFSTSTTDEMGKFRFENVPPGELRVVVEPTEYCLEAVFPTALLKEEVHLKIDVKSGESIEGTVIGVDGKPAADVAVGWLARVDEQGQVLQGKEFVNLSSSRMTRSGQDGKFRIGPIAEGSYRVTSLIEAPDRSEIVVIAKAGQKDVMIRHDAPPEG